MDFIALNNPLSPELMDNMLAAGYYRVQQSLFTLDYARTDDGRRVRVIWARVNLKDFQPNNRHLKLAKRCRALTLSLHPAAITEEIEAIYAIYRASIDFDGNASVHACLFGPHTGADNFPGRMWLLRDGTRIVGVGYFDEGMESCAGILNFFHPDYSKYSPGLWMYLEGLRYAAETGKRYYYPGYVALNFPKFDYKLLAGPDRMELWDPARGVWIPYAASIHAERRAEAAFVKVSRD